MVDNTSQGRAGISLASGWRRDDFVMTGCAEPPIVVRRAYERYLTSDGL